MPTGSSPPGAVGVGEDDPSLVGEAHREKPRGRGRATRAMGGSGDDVRPSPSPPFDERRRKTEQDDDRRGNGERGQRGEDVEGLGPRELRKLAKPPRPRCPMVRATAWTPASAPAVFPRDPAASTICGEVAMTIAAGPGQALGRESGKLQQSSPAEEVPRAAQRRTEAPSLCRDAGRHQVGLERGVIAETGVAPAVVVGAGHRGQLSRGKEVIQAPPSTVP